jgi:hypothetical protein
VQTSASISAGADFTMQSGVMECASYPQKAIIFARQAKGELNTSLGAAGSADFFAGMKNLSVKIGQKDNIFSDCDQLVLYDITRHNGLVNKLDFSSWCGKSGTSQTLDTNRRGSIFCFDFIKDAGSSDGKVATTSVESKFNLQIKTSTFTNLNASAHAFELYVILIYDGLISVVNRKIATQYDTVAENVQSVISGPRIDYSQVRPMIGGSAKSFFSGLWSGIKKIAPALVDVARKTGAISKGLAYLPVVGPAASTMARSIGFGDGEGGMLAYGDGEGGRFMPKKKGLYQRRR